MKTFLIAAVTTCVATLAMAQGPQPSMTSPGDTATATETKAPSGKKGRTPLNQIRDIGPQGAKQVAADPSLNIESKGRKGAAKDKPQVGRKLNIGSGSQGSGAGR